MDWQLLFNLDKCHILHFGKNNPCYDYHINGYPLTSAEEEKDLRVYIKNDCLPTRQVTAAALKANQVLGQLLRTFTYRDRNTFVRLYKQYMHPHLEYCVQAWCPWLQSDITNLENVQKRAINAISDMVGTYDEKLAALRMTSLQQRRVRGDMIQTFKIVKKIDNVDPSKYFKFSASQHPHSTRQATFINNNIVEPSYGLLQGASKLELHRNFFSQRVVGP